MNTKIYNNQEDSHLTISMDDLDIIKEQEQTILNIFNLPIDNKNPSEDELIDQLEEEIVDNKPDINNTSPIFKV